MHGPALKHTQSQTQTASRLIFAADPSPIPPNPSHTLSKFHAKFSSLSSPSPILPAEVLALLVLAPPPISSSWLSSLSLSLKSRPAIPPTGSRPSLARLLPFVTRMPMLRTA
eukprot:CAMPEP_0182512828 /NCGR_PEP_ID=MMETSP1321-20130603/32861_1 /TAXON_ID=91990 /ORGANISM="Bolidomonas sp., Strain RCC1657" /LENGTH=111 /DNA_ID=CAMNT_0024719723 /DNA_START=342 /DNA_END=673 /DNA_ORIENTATION=-